MTVADGAPSRRAARRGIRTPLLILALFLILVGSRAALIAYAGSATPFLDEWDADAAHLLAPWLEGRLSLADLLHPINEHRILFTKLAVLSIYAISGYWDVVLQMIVNAAIDAATVVALAAALARVLTGGPAVAAMILMTAVNAIPFGYDNIVLGFNTHFYLLIAFSLAAMLFLADGRAWSWRWAAGVACAIASSLCLASGTLTLAAAGVGQALQIALGRRKGRAELLGLAAIAALTLGMAALVPRVPLADELRAHSVAQAAGAVVALASWPAWPWLGLILFLPGAVFVGAALRDRPPPDDPRWFNIFALGWVSAQILVLAIGRGQMPLQYRYFDFLLVGLCINIVSAFWLYQRRPAAGARWPGLVLAAWLALLAASLIHPQRHLWFKIEEWRTILAAGSDNVRRYVATGDASALNKAPAVEIPAFDAGPLRALLDTPALRAALPPDLRSEPAPANWVERLKSGFLRFAWAWFGLGVGLLAAALWRGGRPVDAVGVPRESP